LNKILAFSIYLLGAKRRSVANMVGMPEESVKTAVRVVLRDGFSALRDRRCSSVDRLPETRRVGLRLSARRENECCIVDFGVQEKELRIPLANRIEARTVLLSLLNAELLPTTEVAAALGLSCAHSRELAGKLSSDDVVDALVDKRQGQKQDYRVGPEKKAEIIQQFAARVVAGQSASSDVLAKVLNAGSETGLSPRTVRWHMEKLGLGGIRKTLPELVRTLKKTS
jgi:DNA-binding transcriptional ArsR family regulator